MRRSFLHGLAAAAAKMRAAMIILAASCAVAASPSSRTPAALPPNDSVPLVEKPSTPHAASLMAPTGPGRPVGAPHSSPALPSVALPGNPSASRPSGLSALPNPAVPAIQKTPIELTDLLERFAAYCDRLSGAVLDFVCLEKIKEMFAELAVVRPANDPALAGFESGQDLVAIAKSSDPGLSRQTIRVRKRIRPHYAYDYQLVKKQGEVIETRTLLDDNGRAVIQPNAPLKTMVFSYGFVVMGPASLLGRDRQELFDYEIVKEAKIGKDRAVVLRVTPKPGLAQDILHGQVWVRTSDVSILRIEWVPESIGHYERARDMALQLNAKPLLTLTTEFSFEKNGIRFPSRYAIEEKYIFEAGPPLVLSTTDVEFKDYKFFIVETGVVVR